MKFNQLLLSALCVLLINLSSCKKDIQTNADAEIIQSESVNNAMTADDIPETAYPLHTPIYSAINSNCAGYYETLPARYNLTTKQYPLIIFIHGIGELGTGLKINCCGIPSMASRHLLPPEFIIDNVHFSPLYVSPQFKVRPSAEDVQAVINYAVQKYRVDPTRIYVTGLSMGGGSTIDYANVYGQNVTAIVPVCGGTAPTTSIANNIASKNIPTWGIYSNGDQVVPYSWGIDLINWMKADNPGMSAFYKLTVYNGLSHNSTWGTAFTPTQRTDGYNLYEWLLRFKKGSAPSNGTPTPAPAPAPSPSPAPAPTPAPAPGNKAPTAIAGADQVISLKNRKDAFLNGAFSKDADGWLNSYTWTKLSGPSTILTATSLTQAHAYELVPGIYAFRLTVTDNKGASSYDDLQVTVTN